MALRAMRDLAQVLALGALCGCAPRQAALEALRASQQRHLRALGVSVYDLNFSLDINFKSIMIKN